ncbi:MAG: glycosyltransferase family 4 protein, partial [Candidatus Rokuibacteriota bacterium]
MKLDHTSVTVTAAWWRLHVWAPAFTRVRFEGIVLPTLEPIRLRDDMRVLYWSDLFWPYGGGPELFARSLLPALRDRGLEISVVTSHDHLALPDRCHLDGVEVYRVPMRAALVRARVDELAAVAHQITRIKREVSPDVIHVSGVGPGAVFHLMTEKSCPAPFLVSLRTEVLGSQRERHASLLERALRRASWVTAVSSEVLRQARELTPDITNRSSVVYNFLHAPDWTPGPLPFTPPRLLCVGRLIPAKGFDLAVKAFASVVTRRRDARLTVVGDGPEREGLERLVRDLRLDGAVEVAGPIAPSGLPGLLGSATLVLVPSRR